MTRILSFVRRVPAAARGAVRAASSRGQPTATAPESDDAEAVVSAYRESIGLLGAQLDEQVAEAERYARALEAKEATLAQLYAELAAYRRPYEVFPGGCGVDVFCFPGDGSEHAIGEWLSETGHRVFVVRPGPPSAGSWATTVATRPGRFDVLLPDEDRFGALDELRRRAGVAAAIAFVEDQGWADLVLAAQERLGWYVVYRGPRHEQLVRQCDLLLAREPDRSELEERIRGWYPKAVVVIPSVDNLDYLVPCLDALFQRTLYPAFEVIVVDNGSPPAVVEQLRRREENEPRLRVLEAGNNLGFARASNLGIASAPDAEYVVLLNDDTVVTTGWLGGLVRYLADERVGLVGPTTNNAGNEARVEVPYADAVGAEEFAAERRGRHAGEAVDVAMLAMYCVAFRRRVLEEIGPLDERFTVGMYEDDDYAMRVRQARYRLLCARDVFVHHWGGASLLRLDPTDFERVHATHRATFTSIWGRRSASADAAGAADLLDERVRALAAVAGRRFGCGDLPVSRRGDGLSRLLEAWPAALVDGERDLEEGDGAALMFEGRIGDRELAVALAQPLDFHPPDRFVARAFVPVFNEVDLLEASVRHLLAEGVAVHVIDNWSNDGSWELALELAGDERVDVERFPADPRDVGYDWAGLLTRIEQLAAADAADWAMLVDADEFRVSPWPRVSLRSALWAVQQAGFNAVDHTVITFPPVDDEFAPGDDPQTHFRFSEFWCGPGYAPQVKAWAAAGPVDVTQSGGHAATFVGRRIFPFNFLDKHYPYRSQRHAEQKVFRDRLPRWRPEELARGWHAQYEGIGRGHSFLRRIEELEPFDPDTFVARHFAECLARVGICGRERPPADP